MLTEKLWGWSERVVNTAHCEVHRIDVICGGYSSWHKHQRRDNVFHGAKGRLVVEYHDDAGDIVQQVLSPGDTFTVEAGVVHRFRAPFESARAVEVYYPSSPAGLLIEGMPDIIRYGVGGRDNSAGADARP